MHVRGCRAEYWNATEWLGIHRKHSLHTRASDMSPACFWPCGPETEFVREYVPNEQWAFAAACFVLVMLSRRLASSRSMWIAVCTIATIAFSFAVLGYLVSSLREKPTAFAWATMGFVASIQASLLVYKGFVDDGQYWIAVYAMASGSVGFALARAFIPLELDARLVIFMETLISIAGAVGIASVVPSPVLNLATCCLALYMRLDPRSIDAQWDKMGEAYTRDQVRALMTTPNFIKWMEKNHMRLRKLR